MASKSYRRLAPIIGAGILCLLWEDLIRISGTPIYVLPAPSDIIITLFEEITPGGGPTYVFLAKATFQTGLAALVGFLLAATLGVLLGTLLASVTILRHGVYPLANLLQMVPIIAIAPLLNIWFGYGIFGVSASAMIVSIFPVIANTVDGLRSVNPQLIELFSVYGATRRQRWRMLEVPAALPQIFTGLRIAAGLAVIGAVVGELVSGVLKDPPIGAVIASNLRTGKLDLVFSAIVCSAIVGFSLFGLVSWISNSMMGKWSAQHRREMTDDQLSPQKQKAELIGFGVLIAITLVLTYLAFVSPRLSSSQDELINAQQTSGDVGSTSSQASTPPKILETHTTPSGTFTRIRIQLNWVPEPEFGGIYEAKRLGFDHEEGLDFQIISGSGGTPSAQLIAQDKVEFGVVDGTEIISMRSRGAPLVAIYASFQTSPTAIITRREGAPENLEALWNSDRRLAIEAGSNFMRWLSKSYGKSSLEWVSSQGGLAQFKQDPNLAQAAYVFSEPVTLKIDGIETKVFSVAESGFNPYAVVMTTSERFLRDHPNIVKGVHRAMRRGWTSYLKNSQPTNRSLSRLNPSMSFEAMELATEFARPYIEGLEKAGVKLGEMKLERWRALKTQLQAIGVISDQAQVKPQECFWQP
jgi:NitT/TauT family transport system substrate-binding protein